MTIVENSAPLDARPRPPLGVKALFNRTGRLFTGAFWPLVGSCFIYFVAMQILTVLVVEWLVGVGVSPGPLFDNIAAPTAIQLVVGIVGVLVAILIFSAFYGAIIFVALKREDGSQADIGAAFGMGLRFMLPMFLSFIVVGLMIGFGFAALVVPGLWLIGVYGLVPVAMIGDNRARGVLGRTRRLTKDYRWPLVGFFALLYVAVFFFSILAGIFAILVPADPGNFTASVLSGILIDAPVSAVTTAIVIAGTVVAYRRLVEIKEGEGSGVLREVFE